MDKQVIVLKFAAFLDNMALFTRYRERFNFARMGTVEELVSLTRIQLSWMTDFCASFQGSLPAQTNRSVVKQSGLNFVNNMHVAYIYKIDSGILPFTQVAP